MIIFVKYKDRRLVELKLCDGKFAGKIINVSEWPYPVGLVGFDRKAELTHESILFWLQRRAGNPNKQFILQCKPGDKEYGKQVGDLPFNHKIGILSDFIEHIGLKNEMLEILKWSKGKVWSDSFHLEFVEE